MIKKESYAISHYVFNTGHKEYVSFNTGRRDDLISMDYRTLSLDRVHMLDLVEKAKKQGGIRFSKAITFKINKIEPSNQTQYTSCHSYEATFYCGGRPFLITLGSCYDYDHEIWNRAVALGAKYQICTPLAPRVIYNFIVDVLIPTEDEEAMYFMYINDLRKFTRNLGLSMLTPASALF